MLRVILNRSSKLVARSILNFWDMQSRMGLQFLMSQKLPASWLTSERLKLLIASVEGFFPEEEYRNATQNHRDHQAARACGYSQINQGIRPRLHHLCEKAFSGAPVDESFPEERLRILKEFNSE